MKKLRITRRLILAMVMLAYLIGFSMPIALPLAGAQIVPYVHAQPFVMVELVKNRL